jgi:phage I-like protein
MKKFMAALASSLLTQCAVLTVALDGDGKAAPTRICIIPDGDFDATDGRPGNIEGVTAKKWRMDATIAQAVIAQFKAEGADIPIDYEHQTLKAADNGQPAPAAGWITTLEYVPATGLIATVRWTDAAAAHLVAGEYRYLSPVFFFDPHTGAVQALHSVALTNKPALGALGEIAALVARMVEKNSLRRLPGSGRTTNEDKTMDKTKILVALGMALDTGDDSAIAALTALVQKAAALEAQVATLKANQFDATKHIPLEEHAKLATELATLKAAGDKAEHERLLQAALDDARILPPNEAYWRAQPLAALQAFLKDAKPVAALTGTQTGGKPPAGGGNVDIKDADAIAKAALKYQREQADAGSTISTAQAVAHITKGASA